MFSPNPAASYAIFAEALDLKFWLVLGGILVVACYQFRLMYDRIQTTKRLKTEGIVTRAWIVQANDALYEKGSDNRPAILIASLPGKSEANDQELQAMAAQMFSLREATPRSDAEKYIRWFLLDDDYKGHFGDEIPLEFTGGKKVHWFHMRIDRKSLPDGVLTLPYVQIQALEHPKSGKLWYMMVPYSHNG